MAFSVSNFSGQALAFARRNKKGLTIAGAGGGVAALLVGGFFALLPLKLEFIIKNISQKFLAIPERAIEARVEKIFERYATCQIVKARRCSTSWADEGLAKSVYRHWRAARFEDRLLKKQGIEFDYDRKSGRHFVRKNGLTEYFNGDDGFEFREVKRSALRREIKLAIKNETRWDQVYKRRTMRRVLLGKYGVGRWSVFEDQRDKVNQKRLDVKKKFYHELVDRVVTPVSNKYGLLFNCLIEGEPADCRNSQNPDTNENGDAVDETGKVDEKLKRTSGNESDQNYDDKDPKFSEQDTHSAAGDDNIMKEAVEEGAKEAIDNTDVPIGKAVIQKIQAAATKKILSIVGYGIGILEIISRIDQALNDGTVSQFVSAKNAGQYANFFSTYATAADQLKAGELTGTEVGVVMEQLDGVEESRIFQQEYLGGASSKPVECGNQQLKPGELVCPDKKVSAGFTVDDFYDNPLFNPIKIIAEAYRQSVGRVVGPILDFVSGAVDFVLGPVIDKLVDITGLDEWLKKGLDFVFGFFFGPVISGTETGGELFNAAYAGADVSGNAVSQSIGGRAVTQQEALAMHDEIEAGIREEWSQRSLWARLFSPENPNSLTVRVAIGMPVGPRSFINQAKSHLANLLNVPNYLASLFIRPAWANTNPRSPHDVIQYAFPAGESELNADPSRLTDEYCEQVEKEYYESKQVNRSISPYVPVFTKTNPCALERVAVTAASAMFTDEDDGGLGLGDPDLRPTTASATIDQTKVYAPSANVACAKSTKDLGVADGYHDGAKVPIRICAIPGFPSSSAESNNGYGITGAEGMVIVNSRVSGAVLSMVETAKRDNVSLSAISSFRTMAHQQALWANHPDPTFVARPGYSNHQMGLAIDFGSGGAAISHGSTMWNWLVKHAKSFGYENYPAEAWHWSPTGN